MKNLVTKKTTALSMAIVMVFSLFAGIAGTSYTAKAVESAPLPKEAGLYYSQYPSTDDDDDAITITDANGNILPVDGIGYFEGYGNQGYEDQMWKGWSVWTNISFMNAPNNWAGQNMLWIDYVE